MTEAAITRPTSREIVFSRLIAAPVERVWSTWSDLRHLHAWFGPSGFTITTTEFTFAPNGVWRFTMHGPDGTHNNPTVIVFRTIEPNRRIVYENGWDLPGAPLDFVVTVTFVAVGNGTRLRFQMTFADDDAVQTAVEQYGVLRGGVETFERLAALVENVLATPIL
jgi:uncharacterized protein YndB with AHSA1/START domain